MWDPVKNRAIVTEGAGVRTTLPLPESDIDSIHDGLVKISVSLPAGKTTAHMRQAMRDIRDKRNAVGKTIGFLYKQAGRRNADLARVDRIIEANRGIRLDRQDLFSGTTNDKQREGRLRNALAAEYDAKAGLEEDLARINGALSHARMVLDELRGAFDEISRMHASIELDWKITAGQG